MKPGRSRRRERGIRLAECARAVGRRLKAIRKPPTSVVARTVPRQKLQPLFERMFAPRDSEAIGLYRLVTAAGLRVPHDISILSFDNYPILQFYPIDTVDFGFGHLGYCPFHAITGDLPLKRDQEGGIPSRATVIARGSVAAPGRRRLI